MDRGGRRLTAIVLGVLAVSAAGGDRAGATNAAGRLRIGSAAQLPSDARATGSVGASQVLTLSIAVAVAVAVALAPRDPSGLRSYATAVSTRAPQASVTT